MVTLIEALPLRCGELESMADTVKVDVPGVEGTPVTVQFEFRVRPPVAVPEQEYGAVPPLTLMEALYAESATPAGSVVAAIVSEGVEAVVDVPLLQPETRLAIEARRETTMKRWPREKRMGKSWLSEQI
jgi:hypothetical protein